MATATPTDNARAHPPTGATRDEELDAAVTRRIDGDERLRGHTFSVDVYRGIVVLAGEARSAAERRLAEELAAAVPGVRAVATRLDVAGASGEPYPVVALPRIDAVVATARGPLGRLRRVVMDARVRRVTHLVVELSTGGVEDASLAARDGELVLIPVEAVRTATEALVRVRLTPADVAGLPAFDAVAYPPPARTWEPPSDYRRDDVRVAR